MSAGSQSPRAARRVLAALGCLIVAACAPCTDADGDSAWRYAIGVPRLEQQGNFCLSEEDTLEIAYIFEKFTPKAGYAALANAPGCSIRIESFTPRRVVKRITVAEGKPSAYRVSFVEVLTVDGETRFLVTTREVRE